MKAIKRMLHSRAENKAFKQGSTFSTPPVGQLEPPSRHHVVPRAFHVAGKLDNVVHGAAPDVLPARVEFGAAVPPYGSGCVDGHRHPFRGRLSARRHGAVARMSLPPVAAVFAPAVLKPEATVRHSSTFHLNLRCPFCWVLSLKPQKELVLS